MKFLLFILAITVGSAPLLAQTGASQSFPGVTNILTLLPEVQITADAVYLQDILPPSQKTSVPLIRLGPSPGIGRVALISRAQINILIHNAEPAFELPAWVGAETIRLTRKVKVVSEDLVRKLITARLQEDHVRDRGELDLRFAQSWTPVTVPDERLGIKILDIPAGGILSAFSIRFELFAGNESIGQYAMSLQARIWHDLPVARALIARGTLVANAPIGFERRDLLSVREPMLELPVERDLEFNDSVPAGASLSNRLFRQRPLVVRGALIEAQVRQGAMVISVKVEALEDGLLGSSIRVRNSNSKREFRGKVQDENTVSITL